MNTDKPTPATDDDNLGATSSQRMLMIPLEPLADDELRERLVNIVDIYDTLKQWRQRAPTGSSMFLDRLEAFIAAECRRSAEEAQAEDTALISEIISYSKHAAAELKALRLTRTTEEGADNDIPRQDDGLSSELIAWFYDAQYVHGDTRAEEASWYTESIRLIDAETAKAYEAGQRDKALAVLEGQLHVLRQLYGQGLPITHDILAEIKACIDKAEAQKAKLEEGE